MSFELGFEIYVYFVIAALYTGVIFVVTALAGSPLAWWWGRRWYLGWTVRLGVLFLALYLSGLPGHLLSVRFLRGRYYVSGDPLVDFLPFLLPGDWIIDPSMHGRWLNGATAATLYPWWACMAVPTWGLAIVLYRHLMAGTSRNERAAG